MTRDQFFRAVRAELVGFILDGYEFVYQPVEVAPDSYMTRLKHKRNGNIIVICVDTHLMTMTIEKNHTLTKTIHAQ